MVSHSRDPNREGSVGAAAAPRQPSFFSRQVKYVRSFYLDLAPPSDVRLAVVSGGYEHCKPDYVIDRTTFPYFGLEFVSSGTGSLELAGRSLELGPGVVFCYGPKVPHRIVADESDPPSKYFVDFTGAEAAGVLEDCGLGAGAYCHVAAPEEIELVFDALVRDGSRGGVMAPQLCGSLLRYLLLRVADSSSPSREDHTGAYATYLRCRQHIQDHHIRLGGLREIAEECGVDEAYLCRLFKRYDRQSPAHFLTRLKMNRAAKLLEDPGQLVKTVAAELGYRDAFHFSRAFKIAFGVSPRAFRQTFDDSSHAV